MGIYNFEKFRKTVASESSHDYEFGNMAGQKVAVDAMAKLYEIIIAIRGNNKGKDLTTSDGRSISHVVGTFSKVLRMLETNIEACWVFDGEAPEFKNTVLEIRKRVRTTAEEKLYTEEDLSDEDKIKLSKRSVCVSSDIIDDVKKLLTLMGISYVQAVGEADAQCAALVIAHKVDGVMTEDTDTLVFGATKIYKNVKSSTNKSKKIIREVDLNEILRSSQLTRDEFIEYCILLGTDYNLGVKNIGPITLYNEFIKHRSIKKFIEFFDKNKKIVEEEGKKVRIEIPKDIRENSDNIIKYYKEAVVIDPNYINIEWKEPNYTRLEKFLTVEFEMNSESVSQKIERLKELWAEKNKQLKKITGGFNTVYLKSTIA